MANRIHIKKMTSSDAVSSRDMVQYISKQLKALKQKEFVLDFKGIKFVSRSAADELLNLKVSFNDVLFVNVDSHVAQMVRLAAASQALPQKESLEVKKVSLKNLFAS